MAQALAAFEYSGWIWNDWPLLSGTQACKAEQASPISPAVLLIQAATPPRSVRVSKNSCAVKLCHECVIDEVVEQPRSGSKTQPSLPGFGMYAIWIGTSWQVVQECQAQDLVRVPGPEVVKRK